jgi:hypothetical protein
MTWAKAKINNNIRKAHFVLEGPSCMSALKTFSQSTFVETVPYNQGTKLEFLEYSGEFRGIPL